MSLITRCPTCETMFRVVPDQLRVSEGWVRCGQCAEVFDASQNMVPPTDGAVAEPPTPTVPAAGTRAATTPEPARAAAPPPEPVVTETTPAADTAVAPQADAGDAPPLASTPATKPAQRLDSAAGAMPDAADAATPADLDWLDTPQTDPQTAILPGDDIEDLDAIDSLPAPQLDFPPLAPHGRTEAAGSTASTADADANPSPRPSFLHDERQPSIWQRPAVRLALVLLVLALLALLGMQFLVKERDRVAAMQPAMLPVLASLCTVAGCSIAPLRQIDSIVIDSSSFSRVRGDDYRLGFSLKNTALTAVAMPAIELSLTDAQDQAVIRRVLMPAEFGAHSDALASSAIWTGSLALTVQADGDAGAQRIAGYRLLAFYP